MNNSTDPFHAGRMVANAQRIGLGTYISNNH